MITEMTYARQMLSIGGYKLVVCAKDSVHVSEDSGLDSLLSLVGEDTWIGAAAADKVVGKAAAMLFVLLRVKSLYAEVITETAKAVVVYELKSGTMLYHYNPDGRIQPTSMAKMMTALVALPVH